MKQIVTSMKRRDFLTALGAAAGAFATGCATVGDTRAHLRLACQMWSVNEIWKKDPAGTLAKMRDLGYEGIQSMAFWKWDRKELRKLLDDSGMVLVDMPIFLSHVDDKNFNSTVEFCKQFGVDFVFVPSHGGKTKEDWMKFADGMQRTAQKLREHGIKMGFHNHQVEFKQKYDGVSPMHMFFERPELQFELDVGHATLAGENSVETLKRIWGRVPSIHAKPGGGNSCGGEGDRNDWAGIIDACRGMGTRWAVVECEERRDRFDDIDASAKFLASRI